jgi:hypothetical protein
VKNQKQELLPLPADEAEVLAQAEVLFMRSPTVRRKYGQLDRALADPVAGKSLRLCAQQLVLSGLKNTGRRA